MSYYTWRVADILSKVVLRRHLGLGGGLLDKENEDELTEDSDYESEHEPACGQVSKNIGSEQREEQRLLPVLGIGSSVA